MKVDLKIFTDDVEPEAVHQIYTVAAQLPFVGSKIRIMPDVHAGNGCVVGFTATMGDKLIPGVLGVDLGCGMLTVELGKAEIDLAALDDFIKEKIPYGSGYRKSGKGNGAEFVNALHCRYKLRDLERLYGSLGTLGGGNHFIEIDSDEEGNKYLVIHSGSRNLGLQVAKIYSKLAVERCKFCARDERAETVARLKAEGRVSEIPAAIDAVTEKYAYRTKIPAEYCYLDGADLSDYLDDVRICQKFAEENRKKMADDILKFLKIYRYTSFETVHNYMDEKNVVRKGAIAAPAGKRVLIPMNMRDGCVIACGKGNADWNESAPHGAGRILKRSEAKKLISLEEFRREMANVYTTTVSEFTIDESPMAYKPTEEILSLISPTVEIEKVIKPIYNFKASE